MADRKEIVTNKLWQVYRTITTQPDWANYIPLVHFMMDELADQVGSSFNPKEWFGDQNYILRQAGLVLSDTLSDEPMEEDNPDEVMLDGDVAFGITILIAEAYMSLLIDYQMSTLQAQIYMHWVMKDHPQLSLMA